MDEELERARLDSGLSVVDLWIGYIALGGMASPTDLEAILTGAIAITRRDHDLLAQVLNERFWDLGLHHSVTYFTPP